VREPQCELCEPCFDAGSLQIPRCARASQRLAHFGFGDTGRNPVEALGPRTCAGPLWHLAASGRATLAVLLKIAVTSVLLLARPGILLGRKNFPRQSHCGSTRARTARVALDCHAAAGDSLNGSGEGLPRLGRLVYRIHRPQLLPMLVERSAIVEDLRPSTRCRRPG
jgi:hypothetical protein